MTFGPKSKCRTIAFKVTKEFAANAKFRRMSKKSNNCLAVTHGKVDLIKIQKYVKNYHPLLHKIQMALAIECFYVKMR